MSVQLRIATASDYPAILELWRRSVEAAHDFLKPADIDRIAQPVPGYLDHVRLTVAVDNDRIVGFIGTAVPNPPTSPAPSSLSSPSDSPAGSEVSVEMLFVDPSVFGRGVGSALLQSATKGYGTVLVDVNEQNPSALQFYKSRGFEVVGRSERDSQGDPFPLLHLRRGP